MNPRNTVDGVEVRDTHLLFKRKDPLSVFIPGKLFHHQRLIGPPGRHQVSYDRDPVSPCKTPVELVKREHGATQDHHGNHQQGNDDIDGYG